MMTSSTTKIKPELGTVQETLLLPLVAVSYTHLTLPTKA
jgi:hypothetical protein